MVKVRSIRVVHKTIGKLIANIRHFSPNGKHLQFVVVIAVPPMKPNIVPKLTIPNCVQCMLQFSLQLLPLWHINQLCFLC